MPVSNKTFNESNSASNPEILEYFVKSEDKAYSLTELKNKFGTLADLDLLILIVNDNIESKFILGEYYYRLKLKK
jgi:hypothetical protein